MARGVFRSVRHGSLASVGLLALLTLPAAQNPAPLDPLRTGTLPTLSLPWGPYPNQRINVWVPPKAAQPTSLLIHFAGGGFGSREPLDYLARKADDPKAKLIHIRETLLVLYQAGILVASAGATGADGESPPGNLGSGVWRPPGHLDWQLPASVTWYEKDTLLAVDTLKQQFPALQRTAAMGVSAGAMQSFWSRPDFVVALNCPVSWPATRQDLAHATNSYLPDVLTGEPVEVVGDASLAAQIGASMNVMAPKAIFFGNQYPAAHGVVDFDPATGVRDLLAEVHDYGQSAWAYLERGSSLDELWAEAGNELGIAGESSYSGSEGVRGAAMQAEIRRWLLVRLSPASYRLSRRQSVP